MTQQKTSLEALTGLRNVIRRVRALDPEIPAQTVECFLLVCLKPGITVGDLAVQLGLAKSSASRNVQALSRWHRLGQPGLDLVEAIEDMADRRTKLVTLTNKGKRLRDELADLL